MEKWSIDFDTDRRSRYIRNMTTEKSLSDMRAERESLKAVNVDMPFIETALLLADEDACGGLPCRNSADLRTSVRYLIAKQKEAENTTACFQSALSGAEAARQARIDETARLLASTAGGKMRVDQPVDWAELIYAMADDLEEGRERYVEDRKQCRGCWVGNCPDVKRRM